jgi:uridine kinase
MDFSDLKVSGESPSTPKEQTSLTSQNSLNVARSPTSGNKMSGFRKNRHPFVIGVSGGTASGKTTVCDLIMQRLQDQCVVILSQDSFYKSLNAEQKQMVAAKEYNFDHPDAFDRQGMMECIEALRKGDEVDVPVYDFKTHSRSTEEVQHVVPADVVIIEGILVLHMQEIRDLLHMKVRGQARG